MIQRLFTLFVGVLLSALTFSSCSSDDEEGGSKGNFTVDGETYRIEMASCTDGTQEEYADAGCFFEAMLYGEEDAYYFTVELYGIYDLDELKSGEDVTDITGVYSFRPLTSAGSSSYEETNGKVIVKSTSSSKITLEFKNFTFNRYSSDYSYVVNGAIEYDR